MPNARVLIWSLVAFLAFGAVAFAAVVAWFGSLFVRRWVKRRERLALAFDPMRPAPKSNVLPEARPFFAAKRLGNFESGNAGKRE